MARQKERELYERLKDTKFSFIRKGRVHISEVYIAVKNEFPDLCDDSYLCLRNCVEGNNQPEWNHTVRNVMQRIKNQDSSLKYTGMRGYWEFR